MSKLSWGYIPKDFHVIFANYIKCKERTMKRLLGMVFAFTLLVSANAIYAKGISPVGTWTTISDKTRKPRGLVRITERNGVLQARIVKVYRQKGDTGFWIKCPGKLKNKPIKGLRFVWGMKTSGNMTWSGGKILDPKEGKIYRCKMTLDKSGKKLYVRGYIGVSLFGRTQTWVG